MPLLEYASSIWSPYHTDQMTKLESVQRNYKEAGRVHQHRLQKVVIMSWNKQPGNEKDTTGPIAYTYKIVFGLVDDACCELFALSNTVS